MNSIWNNHTDTLETILEDAKREAIDIATNPHATQEAGDWLVESIIDQAGHAINPLRGPVDAAVIRHAIQDVTIADVPVAEYNLAYLDDETTNLDAITLDDPIAITGTAGLWDGTRTVTAVARFDTVGDILRAAPWNDMDADDWSIDDHDDLRYTGSHHDGTNTCAYRILRHGRTIPAGATAGDVRRLTRPIGPLVRNLYGIPAPRRKRGKRHAGLQ